MCDKQDPDGSSNFGATLEVGKGGGSGKNGYDAPVEALTSQIQSLFFFIQVN
jgi:hypothetical protein